MRTTVQAGVYKAGKEVSPETNPTVTLILDFQSSELGENTFLLFKSPSLWYFVMMIQLTDKRTEYDTAPGILTPTL